MDEMTIKVLYRRHTQARDTVLDAQAENPDAPLPENPAAAHAEQLRSGLDLARSLELLILEVWKITYRCGRHWS